MQPLFYQQYQPYIDAIKQPLLQQVQQAMQPDAVILLGASIQSQYIASLFHECLPPSQHASHGWLLVLLPDMDNKPSHEWQEKLEQYCNNLLPITSLVKETASYLDWVQQGHPFAWVVQQQATLLYQRAGMEWPMVSRPNPDHYAEQEKAYLQGMQLAKQFWAGAELYHLRQQYGLAAFMLHQTAEQCLTGLLKLGMGYHFSTHSVDRLLRYASLFCEALPNIFRERTNHDKHLLSLLQKAYIDTRYKIGYSLSLQNLLLLMDKVQQLLAAVEGCGKQLLVKVGA